jgi:hypothetical protein
MHMTKYFGVGFGLLFGLGIACSSDDDDHTGHDSGADTGGTTDDPTTGDADETGDDGPTECVGVGGPNALGDSCSSHSDCESGVCSIYTDSPINDDAVCEETPADCGTRVTGTVFDFSTLEPVSGETVRVVAALDAITNPDGATAIVEGTTDADGRIDLVSESPVTAAIAILAIAGGGDSYLTATGLASPVDGGGYPVGTANRDLWIVPTGVLAQWSEALAEDDGVPAGALPLGENGGIVGLVRDGATGDPISGAVVAPVADGSDAVVRYLDDTGGFSDDVTGESGIFVIFGAPTTGETFAATVDGTEIASTQAGSANNVIFSLILRG